VLFPESTDHSPVKDQIQLQNALMYIQNSNDNSLRSFLMEKFNTNEMTGPISDQYQILNTNVSTDFSKSVNYQASMMENVLNSNFYAETVKIKTISADNVKHLQARVTENQHITEVVVPEEGSIVTPDHHSEAERENKHGFTDMQPVKVQLPHKTVQAFSKIIKARAIVDTHMIEIPSETGNNARQQNKNSDSVDKPRIKASTINSFAVLQEKNGYPKKEKIIESFSKILKKESVSV
jgi:hypothetical protein